jgi:hypothetical protein
LVNYYNKDAIDLSINNNLVNYYNKDAIDLSINNNLVNYYNKSAIDLSVNTNLQNYAKLNAPSFTGTVVSDGDISSNLRLFLGGDASLNGNLYTSKKVFFASDLSVNGNLNALGISVGTAATYNTVFGISSGALITGSNNTVAGYNAATTLTTGSNNMVLGYDANPSSATVSNEITLGNSSITTLRCAATSITSLSDARDKTNIEAIPAGLDFISELNPVKFTWAMRDGGKSGIDEFGFIAQELQEAQKSTGIHYPNLVSESNPDKLEASYATLIPSIVKAIQELKTNVLEQQAEINELKSRL